MKHYLGVDIGTYQTKGVLVDAEGAVAATASRDHEMLTPRPGWAEHRPEEDWWGDVVHVCRTLLAESGVDPASVRAMGASAIGPCMLPVDEAGAPLMNGVLYGVDTRSHEEIEALNAQIGAERVLDFCGNPLTSQAIGPKILWLKNKRPNLYAKAARFVGATSYVVHKLTGAWAVDHYSAANLAPLYDADARAYSDALTGDICRLEQLPKPVWTTEIVGGVTEAAAAATGLAQGTPVIAGTIDAAAEALSVGAIRSGDMMMMYGSTIFIIQLAEKRLRDNRLWYAPWLFEGEHASMAGLATSGTLTHWFRDRFARELDPADAFPTLAAEAAASPPGANGLVLLPYFSGERTPIHDPHAKGVLFGLDLTHDARRRLSRPSSKGSPMARRMWSTPIARPARRPERVLAVGGGVKNAVWSQATSDVSGLTQIVREKTIGASYGDAFLAAMAVGDARLDEIERWNPTARRIAPDPTNAETHRRNYEVFRALYPATKDLMAKIGVR